MSLDASLRRGNLLSRHRNVLTRAERIAKLEADGKIEKGEQIYGLPKVASRKISVGGKVKKKEEPADEKGKKK